MINQFQERGTPALFADVFARVERWRVLMDETRVGPEDYAKITSFTDVVDVSSYHNICEGAPVTLWGSVILLDESLLPGQMVLHYTYNDKPEIRFYHHRCVCSNGDIREEPFDYDFCVVETVLAELAPPTIFNGYFLNSLKAHAKVSGDRVHAASVFVERKSDFRVHDPQARII